MRNSEIVICKYSNCLHETREIHKEEAVRNGKFFYHPDCLETQMQIREIINLFKNKVNPNPVYSQLQSVIKNIVFKKGLGSDFLLFGLKYYIEHNIPLNYPQGLYYVIQNKRMIHAYNKQKAESIKRSIEIKEDRDTPFTHIPEKINGFMDIIQ